MITFTHVPGLGNKPLNMDDPSRGSAWDRWPYDHPGVIASSACPSGHLATISPKIHTISADGALSPSYVCPRKDCSFHDFVKFEGWVA